jgi:hypothetical protein
MQDLTVRLVTRPFLGGVANNCSIAIPKDVTIWSVPKRGLDFDAPGVPQDVYTLRLLADRKGRMYDVMVLRAISDETAEDWINGVAQVIE